MAMPTENGKNSQEYGQWTIDDCRNWLCKQIKKAKTLPASISRIVNLKTQGYCAILIAQLHFLSLFVADKSERLLVGVGHQYGICSSAKQG